jgi:glycosyltransferase involved in cell wall biosynthesis
LHVLVLTDRDWAHPDAGGTGTTLRSLTTRWVDAGHRVTIVAGAYDGSVSVERPRAGLEVHRMGSRVTVFPRAALACLRGLGRDADVVFEVINGIAFFTPLWRFLRAPKVVFLQHVHQRHYVMELGLVGRIAGLLLERLPLRLLYRGISICSISQSSREELIEMGVPAATIEVVYLGVQITSNGEPRATVPTLLYLGRLKRYKRLDALLDVLEGVPEAVLEVAGDGDQREAFEAEVERRGLRERVVIHGFVPEHQKATFYGRAWLALTASGAEGWGLTVMEAATCGTPTAALRVGGLAEAIVDGETGVLADDVPALTARVREILGSTGLRDEIGAAAARRARSFTWERAAREILELLDKVAADGRVRYRMRRPELLPTTPAESMIGNGAVPDGQLTLGSGNGADPDGDAAHLGRRVQTSERSSGLGS